METVARQPQDKVLVEVFTTVHDRTPAEEMVTAMVRGVWCDLVEVRVHRAQSWGVAKTPYGEFENNTIVVCEKHVVHGADYWGLVEAIERSMAPEEA